MWTSPIVISRTGSWRCEHDQATAPPASTAHAIHRMRSSRSKRRTRRSMSMRSFLHGGPPLADGSPPLADVAAPWSTQSLLRPTFLLANEVERGEACLLSERHRLAALRNRGSATRGFLRDREL